MNGSEGQPPPPALMSPPTMAPPGAPDARPPAGATSRSAIASLVLGIVATVLCCVPLVGPICGVIAIAFYVKFIFDFRASGNRLRGRGMSIGGLVTGIVGGTIGLFASIAMCSPEKVPTPTTTRQGDEILLGGQRNEPIAFARSGKYWGAAWLSKISQTNRLHWFETCEQAIFFTVFDDDLNLLLEKPIRVKKQQECALVEISIRGTPRGFAVSPSDVGAEFDLQSRRFLRKSRFPAPSSRGHALKVPEARKLAYKTEILEQAIGENALIRVWCEIRPREPDPDKPGINRTAYVIRYLFSPDGKTPAKTGDIMTLEETYYSSFTMYLLREGDLSSLFVRENNKIFRQRITDDGEKLGELEPLVVETSPEDEKKPANIYNFHAGVIGSHCVLLYTVGNWNLTLYSCETGEKRRLEETLYPTMLCDGTRCIASMSGRVIKFVKP
ncbi:MAG: DUF4190 domain-containing protein [Deltaproteobacteria bacterium]|nr:DUF4190 domain-containing protein [Deltaproteobacteria bacterium]